MVEEQSSEEKGNASVPTLSEATRRWNDNIGWTFLMTLCAPIVFLLLLPFAPVLNLMGPIVIARAKQKQQQQQETR